MSESSKFFRLASFGGTVSMTSLHGIPSNWAPTFDPNPISRFNMKMDTISRFLFAWKITWKCPKVRKIFASLRSAGLFQWLHCMGTLQIGHLPSTLTQFHVFNMKMDTTWRFLFAWKITWKCSKLRKNFGSLRSAGLFQWLHYMASLQLGHLPSTLTH